MSPQLIATEVKSSRHFVRNVLKDYDMNNKHPEVNKEQQELKTLIKDLEKKEAKAKSDLELFSSARQRAASSYFAVTRPRLRKQNPIKYIDRSAQDKDLLVLKTALGNKIPLNESRDWELPFVIERCQHSNIEVRYF